MYLYGGVMVSTSLASLDSSPLYISNDLYKSPLFYHFSLVTKYVIHVTYLTPALVF